MSKLLLVIVLLVIVIGAGYFLMKGNIGQPATTQQTAQPTVSATSPTTELSQAAQEVTIVGNEFAFTPSTITAKQGQPLKITFKNSGKYPHNLTISELSVNTKTIQPGEEDSITFTPTKTGKFSFMCTVPGHADRGMTGTLTVE